jgi:hypothetical protein
MPTSCQLAPFDIEVTRVRSQPSRQAALDVKVIRRIAEVGLELLDIVHDHYRHDLPTVTPMWDAIQGAGGSTHISETFERLPEPGSHCGPGHSLRKLPSRFQADWLSSHADTVDQGNK